MSVEDRSLQGHLYAYLDNLKAGDILLVDDDGFTCMREGTTRTVRQDKDGQLYVNCNDGRHYLDGQLNKDGYLVGLTLYKSM